MTIIYTHAITLLVGLAAGALFRLKEVRKLKRQLAQMRSDFSVIRDRGEELREEYRRQFTDYFAPMAQRREEGARSR